MKKKNILLTFDYEPYLGPKSGMAENCLLRPTHVLQNILDKYKIKGIFFVDSLYVLNLKKRIELQNDYHAVVNQIKELHNNGHYIFPHIHPHWLDSKYLPEAKQFDLSNLEKYSLASLSKGQVENLFEESFSLLNELGINYDEWGYRAGGWCIQPFSNYKEIYRKHNIKFDFSVLPHYKNEKPEQFFDFSKINKITPYQFSDDVTTSDEKGEFTELPISSIRISNRVKLLDKLVRKYLWKIGDKGFGDGLSAQTAALKTTLTNNGMISIDILNISKIAAYKKFITNYDYMHWISHPKMFTNHSLKIFDIFLNYTANKFQVETDFIKMINRNEN